MWYDNITETIGRTPVVRLHKLAPAGVEVYAKLEAFNPMGSVKDRMALATIAAAERSGALKPGQTVIEATSGNTGIALAMVCAQRGYPFVCVMGEAFSIERRKLMRFLGAKVVLTPAGERGSGMIAKAVELAEKHGWYLIRQFENEVNAEVHSATTAQEILSDFADAPLDYWVCGFGTGGTLKGVARVLRQASPGTKIVTCEPDNSQVLGSGLPQPRNADGTPDGAHPAFRPHPMMGWAPDFIPRLTEEAVAAGWIDEILPINGMKALEMTRALATQEGILAGITGGATVAVALEVARRAAPGSRILCMVPDTGERYLSTPLFGDIAVEMDEAELEISRSTPNFRFDIPAAPAPVAPAAPPPALKPEAVAFVEAAITSTAEPVVMFSLEWCEFCWAVRKLFGRFGVPYRSVDLDSLAYQPDNWGGEIRRALNVRTGMKTIPQVFIGGELFGGSTDLIAAWREGRAQQALTALGITPRNVPGLDPQSFLPAWVQPRV